APPPWAPAATPEPQPADARSESSVVRVAAPEGRSLRRFLAGSRRLVLIGRADKDRLDLVEPLCAFLGEVAAGGKHPAQHAVRLVTLSTIVRQQFWQRCDPPRLVEKQHHELLLDDLLEALESHSDRGR